MNFACSNLCTSGSSAAAVVAAEGGAEARVEGGGVGEELDDLGELDTLDGGGGDADPSNAILETSVGRSCDN